MCVCVCLKQTSITIEGVVVCNKPPLKRCQSMVCLTNLACEVHEEVCNCYLTVEKDT